MIVNDRISKSLQAILIVAATLLVYYPVRECGFIWDDNDYVTMNVHLRSWEGLIRIWTDLQAEPQYYPLVHTTFWLEFRAWELNPVGYHAVNVLLHTLNSLLLWQLLRKLGISGSWLAAMLFAVHPVCVESVAWITERKNVLSSFFYLSAAHCFVRFSRLENADGSASSNPSGVDVRTHHWRWYAPMCLLFVCALLSKTVTSTFPAAMLVIVWWKRRSLPWPTILALLPLFAAGIRLGMITAWLEEHHVGASGREWDFTVVERMLIASRAVWFYVQKLLWPNPLMFFYPRWNIDSQAAWQYTFAAAGLVVMISLVAFRRRFPGTLAASLLYVGTLFPALGFVNVYPMRYSFVADHFQYMASMVFLSWLASGIALASERFQQIRIPLYLASATWVAILMYLTFRQVPIYQNLETLWENTLAKNPQSWIAMNNLGNIRIRQGKHADAVALFESAIRLKPDYADAYVNLGKALGDVNRLQEAEAAYRRGVALAPPTPILATSLSGLGVVRARLNDLDEAVICLTRAIELQPDYAEAHYNLAIVFQSRGELDKANSHFRKAAQLRDQREKSLLKQ